MASTHWKRWVLLFVNAILMLFPVFWVQTASSVQSQEDLNAPALFASRMPESGSEYVILVEKSRQLLSVWKYNGRPEKVFETSCSTGKASGPKIRSGDSKTPEGIYFFDREYRDEELAPIYGPRAFSTDYPNLLDRMAEKTGNAIWLHGTNKPLKPRESNGCVALENSDLEKVAGYITLNRTPIIIVETVSALGGWDDPEAVEAFIEGWNGAAAEGTYHDYLSFYSPEYLPDIQWWTDWKKMKKQTGGAENPLKVYGRNLMAFRYSDYYVAVFDQYLSLPEEKSFVGQKKIYLTRQENGFRIIGEEYFPGGEIPSENREKSHPFLLAAARLKPAGAEIRTAAVGMPESQAVGEPSAATGVRDEEITRLMDEWVKAWSSKDIDTYGSHYADDFVSQGMDKSAWIAYKRQLNKKYDYIRVAYRNLQVKKEGGKVVITFIQSYESSGFKATGIKRLELKRESGQWKIYREVGKKS